MSAVPNQVPHGRFPNCLDIYGIDLNECEFRDLAPAEIQKEKWDKAAKHAKKLQRKRAKQRKYLAAHPDAVPLPGCLIKRPAHLMASERGNENDI